MRLQNLLTHCSTKRKYQKCCTKSPSFTMYNISNNAFYVHSLPYMFSSLRVFAKASQREDTPLSSIFRHGMTRREWKEGEPRADTG